MKVLRIYDHLGELKKEFNIYVEGEDFKWQASAPEPVWLGTITLGDYPFPVDITEGVAKELEEERAKVIGKEPEAEPTSEVVVVEPEPEAEVKTELVVKQVTDAQGLPRQRGSFKEVKDEPKKVHRKRSGVKRVVPPSHTKGTEVIPQDDSPGDANQGD